MEEDGEVNFEYDSQARHWIIDTLYPQYQSTDLAHQKNHPIALSMAQSVEQYEQIVKDLTEQVTLRENKFKEMHEAIELDNKNEEYGQQV